MLATQSIMVAVARFSCQISVYLLKSIKIVHLFGQTVGGNPIIPYFCNVFHGIRFKVSKRLVVVMTINFFVPLSE